MTTYMYIIVWFLNIDIGINRVVIRSFWPRPKLKNLGQQLTFTMIIEYWFIKNQQDNYWLTWSKHHSLILFITTVYFGICNLWFIAGVWPPFVYRSFRTTTSRRFTSAFNTVSWPRHWNNYHNGLWIILTFESIELDLKLPFYLHRLIYRSPK